MTNSLFRYDGSGLLLTSIRFVMKLIFLIKLLCTHLQFYVLFKLNLTPCRESWYTTKIISGKPLAYKILYKKEKERGKKKTIFKRFINSIS